MVRDIINQSMAPHGWTPIRSAIIEVLCSEKGFKKMDNEPQGRTESLRSQLSDVAQSIQEGVERMRPTMAAMNESIERFRLEYGPLLKRVAEVYGDIIRGLALKAKEWQEHQKISVAALAELGWFPNWYTFFYYPSRDFKSIDDLMMAHIDDHWDEIKSRIIELSPRRAHILNVAFELHEQNNYIASIPLILAQSDGICSEEFTHFFSKDSVTGRRASQEILAQAESKEFAINFFSEILLEPFKASLQISSSSSKSSVANKGRGPNRHGIIHGSRKHLDYGTQVNGYKAVSFLAFIVYAVKDEFRKI